MALDHLADDSLTAAASNRAAAAMQRRIEAMQQAVMWYVGRSTGFAAH
jgi:hypothetical protein